MEGMLIYATFFDANLSHWDVSRVSNMFRMLAKVNSLRGVGVEHWNTNYVTITNGMFGGIVVCG
jgi:Mycoplasma protein of unknown function, DUF285